MRKGSPSRSVLAVVTAASLIGLTISACTSQVFGLDGTLGKGSSATVSTTPGRPADYTGFLINHTGHVIVLTSAALLPLKGFRSARLVHEAIEPRLRYATSDRDWPPTEPHFPLRSFSGYRLPPGHRVNILYSVIAGRLGKYADTGITVTVLINGRPATVDVISIAGMCVVVNAESQSCPKSFIDKLVKAADS